MKFKQLICIITRKIFWWYLKLDDTFPTSQSLMQFTQLLLESILSYVREDNPCKIIKFETDAYYGFIIEVNFKKMA